MLREPGAAVCASWQTLCSCHKLKMTSTSTMGEGVAVFAEQVCAPHVGHTHPYHFEHSAAALRLDSLDALDGLVQVPMSVPCMLLITVAPTLTDWVSLTSSAASRYCQPLAAVGLVLGSEASNDLMLPVTLSNTAWVNVKLPLQVTLCPTLIM